jgi:hypothetical protein
MSVNTRSDARLEFARRRFPELRFKNLDITQTGIDRWKFTDRKTGVEYRRVDYDPLLGDERADIAAFTIDAGGNLHLLRLRVRG